MKDSLTDFITAKNVTKKTGEKTYRFKCKDVILYRYVWLNITADSVDSAKQKIKQDTPSLIVESYEEL